MAVYAVRHRVALHPGFLHGTAAITLVVIPMLVPLLKMYDFNLSNSV